MRCESGWWRVFGLKYWGDNFIFAIGLGLRIFVQKLTILSLAKNNMDTGIFIEELYQEGKKLIECLDEEVECPIFRFFLFFVVFRAFSYLFFLVLGDLVRVSGDFIGLIGREKKCPILPDFARFCPENARFLPGVSFVYRQ